MRRDVKAGCSLLGGLVVLMGTAIAGAQVVVLAVMVLLFVAGVAFAVGEEIEREVSVRASRRMLQEVSKSASRAVVLVE